MADAARHPRRHVSHACCDDCALRFSPAYAAHVGCCPMCGGDLAPSTPAQTLGHQLYVELPGPPADEHWL